MDQARHFIAVHRPWGPVEISKYCRVERDTVDRWRQRDVLAQPDGETSGRPYWWPETIMRWADNTGRRPIVGILWRYHTHTAVWSGEDGIVHGLGRADATAQVTAHYTAAGIRATGAFDDEHDHLYVRVWPADWAIPRLAKGASLEACDWPGEDWYPVVLSGDIREGDDGAFVRIRDVHTQRMPWSRLRLPGADTTLDGQPVQSQPTPASDGAAEPT